MKIALINNHWEPKLTMYPPALPLGIVYLGTILKNNGYSVHLLDVLTKRWDNKNCLQWVKRINPDVIGFGVLTPAFLTTMDLVRDIKAWNPSIKIVLGNYFASIEADNIIRKYGDLVDFCVRGEGEETMLALVRWLEKTPDKDPVDIKGLTFRDRNHKIVATPDAPMLVDLDAIPFPDRSLIDYDYKLNLNGLEIPNTKFTSMLSSRGCPFSCTYCGCSRFVRQRWRTRSPKNFVEELAIVAEQGYTDVNFVDDNFTLKADRVIEICKLIKKENIDINWHVDGRSDQNSQEMFQWMHETGCRLVWIGFESINQRILDNYNKKSRAAQFNTTIRHIRKANIELVLGLFMIGEPTETMDEIKRTLYYATHADIDLPVIYTLGIYSGVKLWDDAITKGIIRPNDLVDVVVNSQVRKVERWETWVSMLDLTRSPAERDEITRLAMKARASFISLGRAQTLLKAGVRAVKSPYFRNLAKDLVRVLPTTIQKLRELNSPYHSKTS